MKPFAHGMLALFLLLQSCYKEVGVPVNADFTYQLADGHQTVPAAINFTNRTNGATHFKWSFPGGEPAVSAYENPGTISYKQAGIYEVTLEAWNEDERQSKKMSIHLDSAVNVTFDTEVLINDFSPVTVKITNKTLGASTYNWSLEGGTPATFSNAAPPEVTFTTPGEHTIKLDVSNGGQTFSYSKKILVKPPLETGFEWMADEADDDMEAPLTAWLYGKNQQYLRQKWTSSGGTLLHDTTTENKIYFDKPGIYEISLMAGNDKESRTVKKQITVKPNSRLRIIKDVKLGISASHATIGSFYSTFLRKTFRKNDDLSLQGKYIDLAFFGLNQNFGFNKFISPDSVTHFTFGAIPGATATTFINTTENCNCSAQLSAAAFDNMTDDTPLQALTFPANAEGWRQFGNNIQPRIVLFQAQDGRKGAIKVKEFVTDGANSYILVDIKVQKHD